jgi:hypothetical protein
VQDEGSGHVEQTTQKIRQLVDKSVPNQLLIQSRLKLQNMQEELTAAVTEITKTVNEQMEVISGMLYINLYYIYNYIILLKRK